MGVAERSAGESGGAGGVAGVDVSGGGGPVECGGGEKGCWREEWRGWW